MLSFNFSEPGTQEDCDILTSGLRKFNAEKIGAAISSFSLNLTEQGSRKPIGAAYCVLYGQECLIESLWVHPDKRRQGYGKKMMQELEAYCHSKKCKRLLLSTWDFQARPFYEKIGMICEAEIKNHINGVTLFYMTKKLT